MTNPELSPPFLDMTFMSPLSEPRAARLVSFLAEGLDGMVVDVGCGWAELLLRVLEAAPGACGTGLDLDARAIEHGRHLAAERALTNRVTLEARNAKHVDLGLVSGAICIGASQIWSVPQESAQPLDYRSALRELRRMLPAGSRLVYGEGIWSRMPTAAAAAPLAGRLDEFVTLGELIEIAVVEGFEPMIVGEADLGEWDEFEAGYCAALTRWLVEHGLEHPGAKRIRERAARQRAAYLGGYRSILGMAYLGLVAV